VQPIAAVRATQFLQLARELNDAGLIGNTQQCAAYGRKHLGVHYSLMPNSFSFLRKVPRLMPRIVAARL